MRELRTRRAPAAHQERRTNVRVRKNLGDEMENAVITIERKKQPSTLTSTSPSYQPPIIQQQQSSVIQQQQHQPQDLSGNKSNSSSDSSTPPVVQPPSMSVDGYTSWRGDDDDSQYNQHRNTIKGKIKKWASGGSTNNSIVATKSTTTRCSTRTNVGKRVINLTRGLSPTPSIDGVTSSEDERYNPEYRGMDDDDIENNSSSFSSSHSSSSSGALGANGESSDDVDDDNRHSSYYRNSQNNNSTNRANDNNTSNNNDNKRKTYANVKKWANRNVPILSRSISEESTVHSNVTGETMSTKTFGLVGTSDGDDYLATKQDVAYCTIAITSIQLCILMLQLAMCGIAPFDVNMMIGPLPDAFSEWGGKNPYLMLIDNQWWRMITPAFLHVGILHLGANFFCQLSAIALFEREWGWYKWLFVYICSTLSCSIFSNWFDQDTVAVASSGSVMGLFAAKLAQVATFTFFDTNKITDVDDVIRLDQLSSVLCGLTLISLLGSFTYIDWSGNMGGMLGGFVTGMLLFAPAIDGCCSAFLWGTFGLLSYIAANGYIIYQYYIDSDDLHPEEQLADACQYFRSLFPEGYECGCMWDY